MMMNWLTLISWWYSDPLSLCFLSVKIFLVSTEEKTTPTNSFLAHNVTQSRRKKQESKHRKRSQGREKALTWEKIFLTVTLNSVIQLFRSQWHPPWLRMHGVAFRSFVPFGSTQHTLIKHLHIFLCTKKKIQRHRSGRRPLIDPKKDLHEVEFYHQGHISQQLSSRGKRFFAFATFTVHPKAM